MHDEIPKTKMKIPAAKQNIHETQDLKKTKSRQGVRSRYLKKASTNYASIKMPAIYLSLEDKKGEKRERTVQKVADYSSFFNHFKKNSIGKIIFQTTFLWGVFSSTIGVKRYSGTMASRRFN